MNTAELADDRSAMTRAASALRAVRALVGGYLAISILTLAAIVIMRDDAAVVTIAVWIRGTIVAATAILMFVFAVGAARGSARAYLRLRIVSGIMLVAIVVIIALPGTFPLWLKIEQGVCGLILAAVVVIANGRRVRTAFASKR